MSVIEMAVLAVPPPERPRGPCQSQHFGVPGIGLA
jgi:hypothetical protein